MLLNVQQEPNLYQTLKLFQVVKVEQLVRCVCVSVYRTITF